MSTLLEDDPPIARDGKAGFSSWCRRAQHQSCSTAGARCTCACHGTGGQTPPTRTALPDPQKAPMPDTTTRPVACNFDGCERTFGTNHALMIHTARAHKPDTGNGSTPPQPVEKPAKAPAARPAVVSERQALATLATAYTDLCGADVATSIASAGALLDAIATAGWELTER